MAADAKNRIGDARLVHEFLADHQEMSRLLLHTLVCLEDGDVAAAVVSADALNRVAGPHIAYEEGELYPRLADDELDSESKSKMYAEHRVAVLALKKLLDNPDPDKATRREIAEGLRAGLEHAEHCGSLISLLAELPAPEQEQSLRKLLQFRKDQERWTDRID